MSCSPPMCLVRAFLLKKNGRKQNPPKSSKFTICLTPSRKYHRSNSHGSQWTWQRCCHPWHNMGMWTIRCQSKKSGDVPPPEARHKEYKREREKKINQIIYLSVYQRNKESIYLSICLSVCLSICLSKKSNASLWHRTQDMYGYVSNRMPTPTQTWASY